MTQTLSPSLTSLIQKYNLDISIVDSKDLSSGLRIDAEFYKKVFVDFFNKGKNYAFLGDFVKDGYRVVYENTTILSGVEKEEGDKKYTRYIQAADLVTPEIIEDNIGYVDNTDWERYKKGRIVPGEILIEVKGKAEKVAIVPQGFHSKTLISGSLYKLTTNEKVKPEYLLTYLITNIGNAFKDRTKTNTLIAYINKDDLYNIPVPLPSSTFQSHIASLVQEAHKQRELSKSIYAEAENILLSELGLVDWKPSEENIAEKMSIEVELFGRCDAEFFQPKYDELFRKLRQFETKKLGEIVDYEKGVEPGADAYSDAGVPFIRVADVSIQGIDTIEKNISPELYEEYGEKYSPKKNEILFTKDGTIGISFVVNKDMKAIISGAFLRLQKKIDIESEYLALVLNSIVCKLQIERFSGGAIIAHLKPSDAMEILIPILPKSTQSLISEKITASHLARDISKKLLEKAKRAVEIFIEQDEESGIKYLNIS